jgi:hypothetical protein
MQLTQPPNRDRSEPGTGSMADMGDPVFCPLRGTIASVQGYWEMALRLSQLHSQIKIFGEYFKDWSANHIYNNYKKIKLFDL